MSAQISELSGLDDLRELADLFSQVWGKSGEPPINAGILKALAHSGNYVSGVFADGRLIGGLVGWLGGTPPHDLHLHSHILGVLPDREAHGLGFELKQHQRRWCLARGVRVMEWTTDPLVRRNAYFNLMKLGAHSPRYLTDFYGQMRDGINAGDDSDRLLIRWQLDSERAEGAAAGRLAEPDVEKLRGWGSLPPLLASLCVSGPRTSSHCVIPIRHWRAIGESRCEQRWVEHWSAATKSQAQLVRAGWCCISHKIFDVLQVGDKAPDFKLPTTGGQELTLGDALQKYRALVFLFYVLDFTGG